MSEKPETYKHTSTPIADGWEPDFSSLKSRHYYLTGILPTQAFVGLDARKKLKEYTSNFPMVQDDSLPKPPEGSIGEYMGVVLYSTSKPGITFV
jgi:hypothetical protein